MRKRPPAAADRPGGARPDPSYQPSKAELEADLRVDATFEELTAAVVRPVEIRHAKPKP